MAQILHGGSMPIHIGPIQIDPPVILAPMSGVTDVPFRHLARRFGAPALSSEMFASRMLQHDGGRGQKRSINFADEHPLLVQLVGGHPQIMAEAARIAVDAGAAAIDINMGCPAKKIAKAGGGAILMRDEDAATAIVDQVVRAVDVPVTVKMRLGWDKENCNAASLAKRSVDAGACLVTVHGRTRDQLYSGQADWNSIRKVVDAVDVPVIANGDVVDYASAQQAMAESGAAGVMIGRAVCGRPWLAGHIAEGFKTGTQPAAPTYEEQHEILCEHIELLLMEYGNRIGFITTRKHIAWALRGLNGATLCREKIFASEDISQVKHLLAEIFQANGSGSVAA